MVGSTYSKNIRRTILGSLGRYIAILAIIALGVGFFAGVKDTKSAMLQTCDTYVTEQRLYDYRLMSTYGFTEDDVKAMGQLDSVRAAEGSVTADFFSVDRKGNSITLRAHSITKSLNDLKLEDGRLPKADDECVADSHFYSSKDIGRTIRVTDENDDATKDALEYDEYTIVGIAASPYYMMKEDRGTTSLGDGRVTAFLYIPREGFTSEYFTELFLVCKEQGFVFTEEYDDNIKAAKGEITAAGEARGEERLAEIIADARKEIDEGQKELDEGRAEFESEKADAYAQLRQSKATLDEKSKELKQGEEALATQKATLTDQRTQTAAGLQQAENAFEAAQQSGSGATQEEIEALQRTVQELTATLQQIDGGLEQIATQEATIAAGEIELASGYSQYYEGKAEADNRFAEAEQELLDAEQELQDAREDLAELEAPELYIQTREDNNGYSSFESNSEIVDGIAKVFPIFFFLIAALVCSTTMSRMIEEERTQIGALRAMGYTRGKIMWKYMVYSGSAAIIGCVGGFLAGSKYFPYAIWIAYGMMFGFAPIEFHFHWQLALISLIVALICSAGTTYTACRGQLKSTPADILRPRAPKAGKRIFLERMGFLWKRLRFLHKVSARNVFRYKKRMFMMMLGIGGCTALVLTGFGINDSVAGIADHQYDEIEKYDMLAAFSRELTEEELAEFTGLYGDDLANMAILQQTTVTAERGNTSKSCSLMVSDDKAITKAVDFRNDGEKLSYPKEGEALINNKLAEMLGVEEGDTITVEYDDTSTAELTVSAIYRNYVSNYIYINEETYETHFDKTYEPSVAFLTFKEDVNIHDVSERINEFDDIAGISLNQDVRSNVDDMMVSLNYIITLVIGCAGALAFIVLFNLSNINITEREREIATIEVLGFYPREMGSYVFRENLVLVVLGILVGIPAGLALHKFVMSQIVVDMVAFNEVIEPQSFGFTVLVVLGFALVVDVIMRRKLKRINMAEALKSIE
ncbi:MAG: FtsX-like permease family protein [Bacillota bacterium]|nr:FtsX-like permease family protein [Bacillota bacterium]